MRSSFRLYSSVASVLAGLIAAHPATAQSIQDTMSSAYTQSTQLGGARAQQRATDEQVPQALSNWRPTVTATGGITRTHTQYAPPIPPSPPERMSRPVRLPPKCVRPAAANVSYVPCRIPCVPM